MGSRLSSSSGSGSATTDASLLVTGTLPLARLSGITTTQLDAAAGITSGQIASLAASKLTGANTLPDGVLSTNVPLLASANTFTSGPTIFNPAVLATANYGSVSIGGGAWDGATGGHFSGSASGTRLAINATSGATGNLADWQVAGVSKYSVDVSGNLTLAGTLAATSLSGTLADARLSANVPLLNAANTFTAAQTITSPAAATKPLIVKGATSQSANLQEWQNSGGTILVRIDNNGNILSPTGISVTCGTLGDATNGGPYLSLAGTTMTVNSRSATNVGFIAKGTASQSADLQQWQSSAAAVLSSIDKIGRLRSPNVEAVTAGAGANAGTSPPAPVVTGSTDVRGLITWGTGTGPAAGDMVDVTFPTAWAAAPFVVVTPINAATAALLPYVAAATTTGFSINLQAAPAASQGNTVYGVQFHAVG